MDGNELLKRAMALYAETDTNDEDAKTLAVPYINMVLAETFDVNNRMRKYSGKEPMESIPEITELSDTIQYEDKLVKLALPYGLAAKLYFDEDDNPRLTMFLQEYSDRVNQCDRWVVAF